MSTIDETFCHQPIFPKVFGEYKLHFSNEEEQVLAKWKTREHAIEYSLVAADEFQTTYAKPYETVEERSKWKVWDAPFQILHLQRNILKNCDELRSIGQSIIDISNHYVKNAYGIELNDDCILDFSDSWMIKLQGNPEGGPFRKHNHATSWLTGVLYLDDSNCGVQLHNNLGSTFDEDNYPWVFQPDAVETNLYNINEIDIDIEKGKCIIFNSKMEHSLNNFGPIDDTRYSLAFNIWPYGNISNKGGSMLSYPPEPVRQL